MTETPAPTPFSPAALRAVAVRQFLLALRFLLAMTVVTGIVYPMVVLGVGQLVARSQADGSLVRDARGQVVGSALIGQAFDGPGWFLPRPSAAGEGYDAMASGGSNLAADSDALVQAIQQRRATIAAREHVDPAEVPADALTASASGLDPDISPAYAALQVARVAGARHLPLSVVADLVARHTAGPWLGFLGEPRVDVLELNLAVSAAAGQ